LQRSSQEEWGLRKVHIIPQQRIYNDLDKGTCGFMMYREVNKSFQWAAVEDLRIHSIHLFITQEEMDK
jgi:hypothetical protein